MGCGCASRSATLRADAQYAPPARIVEPLFSGSRPYFDNPKTQKPLVKSRVATAFDKGFLNLIMAIRKGLEPSTSGVTGRHSNQLNYRTAGG